MATKHSVGLHNVYLHSETDLVSTSHTQTQAPSFVKVVEEQTSKREQTRPVDHVCECLNDVLRVK